MNDPYFAEFSSEGLMTSEERRRLSLLNYAQSKAAKNRKKKKKKQQHAQKKLTEAERRAQEQARIREEREMRRMLSETNRREAAAGTGMMNPEEPDRPEEPERPLLTLPADEENDINIDIPAEAPAAPAPPAKKAKAKTKTKKKPAGTASKHATRGARFSHTATAAAYPNRITTSGAVTLGILTGVLIGTVIYGRVQTNEIYSEIAEKQAVLDDLNAKNVSMKSEMEGKMTVKNIEEYAENELHLMHLNQSQIEYIQLQTEDEVVITEPEDNFFVVINDYIVSFWEFLRGK